MPRFFFHINNGQDIPDESGMVLDDAREAREEALKTASELLGGDGGEFWEGPDWRMRVTDEAGDPVFTIRVLIDDHNGGGDC